MMRKTVAPDTMKNVGIQVLMAPDYAYLPLTYGRPSETYYLGEAL